MVARVATFALNSAMLAAAMRTQSNIASLQIQTASGKKSDNFGGYGATSKSILDLQVSTARSKTYEDAATSASSRVEVMYSAVGSIADLLTSFKTQLTTASSGSGADTTSLTEAASGFMQDLQSLLNSQYGGRYLFAGSATETAPVDLSSYAASSSGAADTSYYKGNGDIASVSVSSEQTVRYGVTADNAAFEQAIRALSMIANATSPIDSDTLSAALDLTTSALDGVTGVQTRLSLNAQRLESAVSRQQDFQSYADTLSSNLTDVDVASVTAQISAYQAQLEASYSAISKVLSLRLSDYLR